MILRHTFFLILLSLFSCTENIATASPIVQKASANTTAAQEAFNEHKDFSRSYWLGKLNVEKPSFAMESNYFYAEISTKKFGLDTLAWRDGSKASNNTKGLNIPFKITKQLQGINFELNGFNDKNIMANCDLIESGRYFQRRTIRELIWNQNNPAINDYLEVSSWPDSLKFSADFQDCDHVEWQLDLRRFSTVEIKDLNQALLTNKVGQKFTLNVIQGHLHQDGKILSVRARGNKINFKVSPSSSQQIHQNDTLVKVIAQQELPVKQKIPVTYDNELDAYALDIDHFNNGKSREAVNNREELFKVRIQNRNSEDKVLRFVFRKLKNTGPITGISAILRDESGLPSGKHVQISKNWHQGKFHKYQGPWVRAYTLVTVPAGSILEFQYLGVNGFWKGLPAASHNQLALPGYKGHRNHLWEQSALGAWGESICYDPENGLSASITDVRPLMVTPMHKGNSKWTWTNNVGGGEFFSVYKASNKARLAHIQVNNDHIRNCPLLTEVNYSSVLEDQSAAISYTASLSRTDDLVRGIYNVEYKVLKDMSFDRLVLFQIGADRYNYAKESAFAHGHGQTLIKDWATAPGNNQYKGEAFKLDQKNPWVALYKSAPQAYGAAATRGIILRNWQAEIKGQDNHAYLRERGVDLGRRKVSIADITLAPSIKSLKAGDTIKACFEMIIAPQYASDYYGPNTALKTALSKHGDSWKMIAREASDNSLDIECKVGKLLRQRPVLIQTTNNRAEFKVSNGLAFKAVTFTGIDKNKPGLLEIKTGESWKKCSQSDFYQVDYNSNKKCWEYSFSMPLDNAKTQEFRFSLQE